MHRPLAEPPNRGIGTTIPRQRRAMEMRRRSRVNDGRHTRRPYRSMDTPCRATTAGPGAFELHGTRSVRPRAGGCMLRARCLSDGKVGIVAGGRPRTGTGDACVALRTRPNRQNGNCDGDPASTAGDGDAATTPGRRRATYASPFGPTAQSRRFEDDDPPITVGDVRAIRPSGSTDPRRRGLYVARPLP